LEYSFFKKTCLLDKSRGVNRAVFAEFYYPALLVIIRNRQNSSQALQQQYIGSVYM